MTTSETSVTEEISDLDEPSGSSGRLRVAMEIGFALLVLAIIYYLFAPEEDMVLPPLPPQEIDPIIRAQIDAAEQQSVAPATAIPSVDESAPVEVDASSPVATAPATDEILAEGESARRLIANLRDGSRAMSDEEILEQAKTYQNINLTSDAYLLLFHAARQGGGEAAFELASLYDPAHFREGSSLLTEPDSYQAHKWYSKAAKQDIPQAEARLQALRKRGQTAAKNGDASARRLLLNWQ
jgi:TPR repeat protein